jgi:hypothetical protein
MCPFIPQFLWGELIGLQTFYRVACSQSATFSFQVRGAFALGNELLNFVRAISEFRVSNADDRKEWSPPRGMIPDPICGHVQPFSDLFRRKEPISGMWTLRRGPIFSSGGTVLVTGFSTVQASVFLLAR